MAYYVTPDLGLELADPATVQAFETVNVNDNFLTLEAAIVAVRDGGYRYGGQVLYTSSGTFTKASYPGLRAIRVRCVGGGGGSGGCALTAAGEVSIGGSGGGGAYAERFITNIAGLAASETVTVGAGGSAAEVAGSGGAGGASSAFSCVAGGGSGGSGGVAQAALTGIPGSVGGGGSPSGTFDFGFEGGSGHSGLGLSGNRIVRPLPGASAFAPVKGSSIVGGTGAAAVGGITYGGGAIGAVNTVSQASGRAGAAGGSGIVIVDLFY